MRRPPGSSPARRCSPAGRPRPSPGSRARSRGCDRCARPSSCRRPRPRRPRSAASRGRSDGGRRRPGTPVRRPQRIQLRGRPPAGRHRRVGDHPHRHSPCRGRAQRTHEVGPPQLVHLDQHPPARAMPISPPTRLKMAASCHRRTGSDRAVLRLRSPPAAPPLRRKPGPSSPPGRGRGATPSRAGHPNHSVRQATGARQRPPTQAVKGGSDQLDLHAGPRSEQLVGPRLAHARPPGIPCSPRTRTARSAAPRSRWWRSR